MKRVRIGVAAGILVLPLAAGGTAEAHGGGHSGPHTHDAHYWVRSGQALQGDLLRTHGAGAVVRHTAAAHGTVTVGADGSFDYAPAAGFTGRDSFTYTVSDAVSLYPTALPPLATIGGVPIAGGAYGSAVTSVPGSRDEVYGLTDRGPNVDAPDGGKVEPIPSFDPAIGKFRLVNGKAVLEKRIPLRAADGSPYNGQVNTVASTGEKIVDLDGKPLPASPNGYDPEGLVALRDGTFWVSDEYGPFITHFRADGRAIERLSPYDGSLPAELKNRVPNKGMEGLTITPDGRTLVGIMQSALQQPDLMKKPGNVTTLRIVTVDLKTRATHEYLYLLDNPADTGTAVSEITALSPTRFLVDERDGKVQPGAYKKLYEIDLRGATDVKGMSVDGGKSIEAYVGKDTTDEATKDLAKVGVKPSSKKLFLDLGALVTELDPSGGFFGHDKVEGVATTDGGRTLVISNDNDFGIDGVANAAAPYTLHAKTLPNGKQDDGEYLRVDTTKLPARISTATVTVDVR
ncbi:esterase-like activity of phytase family protein [Amycolatopsis panacis]|uniref:Esterase-like activity of phytase family protein n=1 Tax=Amycolatopsis panacis TaxID=2340917 RepID=A0A419I9S5_9PSEU|nr:esterase-like activity of phytase family protein [Amycolatopsis panacis]RJQ89658.1 esterase-like activity of phytase family protein [Amycolatopsis panacis]